MRYLWIFVFFMVVLTSHAFSGEPSKLNATGMPNVDVVIDVKSKRTAQIALKTMNNAKFISTQYYETKFDVMEFSEEYPSVVSLVSPERIYVYATGNVHNKITASFHFKGIEVSDIAKDPVLEVDLIKNPYSQAKSAYLELHTVDLRTGEKFKQVYPSMSFGKHKINILTSN